MSVIRKIRLELGLTQAAFAARLGVTQGTVSRWETGEIDPSARDVLAAERVLDMSRAAVPESCEASQ